MAGGRRRKPKRTRNRLALKSTTVSQYSANKAEIRPYFVILPMEENMIEELVNKALATDKDITMCSYYRDTADEMIPVFMGYQKGVIEREELPMQFILPIIRPMQGDPATNAFMVTKLFKTAKIPFQTFNC